MASPGAPGGCDVLIVHAKDANEWSQYLQNLFLSCRQVRKQWVLSYQVEDEAAITQEELDKFSRSRCIILLLSAELVRNFYLPAVLQSLQEALRPPHKVVKLFCGVEDCDDYTQLFRDWAQWKELTYDDEPDAYIAAVTKAISEGTSMGENPTSSDASRSSPSSSVQRSAIFSGESSCDK